MHETSRMFVFGHGAFVFLGDFLFVLCLTLRGVKHSVIVKLEIF